MSATRRNLLIACALWATLAYGQRDAIQVDVREWREQPAKHLLIHGMMDGRTSFYVMLPAVELWKARLMHFLGGGMGGNADGWMRNGAAVYALANGAMYVESSQGHVGPSYCSPGDTPAELAYAASYAVVQYARKLAVETYGKKPAHSYVFGGSGGGFRSTGMLERFPDVYDGAAPSLGGGTVEILFQTHSLYENYRPLIQSQVAALDQVFRPGGSHRSSDVLKAPEQQRALEALLQGGFPRNSILFMRPSPVTISLLDYTRYQADPEYFDDLWKHCNDCKAGFVEGIEGSVKQLDSKTFRLSTDISRPDDELFGYTLLFTSGALKGQFHTVVRNVTRDLILSSHGAGIEGLQPGDRFTLSNRELLAWRALYRYPRPQDKRQALVEPDRPVGRIRGKMIAVFGADDFNVWPVVGVRYHDQVRRALGKSIDDHFRIHFIEHGVHGGAAPNALDRQVPDGFVMYKALGDVMAWVERDVSPPPGTQYSLDAYHQLVLPKSAALRKGYQPVVELHAGGKSARLDVPAGSEVRFQAEAESPINEIIRAEMDFEGDNKFDETKPVNGRKVAVEFHHRYDKPGTYFPTVRVTDATAVRGARGHGIQNLASVRVVVH